VVGELCDSNPAGTLSRKRSQDQQGNPRDTGITKTVEQHFRYYRRVGREAETEEVLQHVKSRPANVGEKLRTQRFITGTSGFAAPEDAGMAVCVLPGTELAFAAAVRCSPRGLFAWKPRVLNHTTAIFRQVNKDKPCTHHDALEFPNGQMVLLNDLWEGQEATVLQLPAQPVTAAEIIAQERIPHI
jgi:hypothetical protein